MLLEWQRFFRRRQRDAQDALDRLSKVVDKLPSADLESTWFTAVWGRLNFLKDQLLPEVVAHRLAADAIKDFRRALKECQTEADKALGNARAVFKAHDGTGEELVHSAKGKAELAGSDHHAAATQLVRVLEDSCRTLVNIIFDNIHHTNDTAFEPEPSFATRYFRQVLTDVYALAGITANTLDGATQVGMDVESMMMLGGPGAGGMSAGGAWALAGSRSAYGGLSGAYAYGVNPYKDYGVDVEKLDAHWLKKNWKNYDQKWNRKGPKPPKLREIDPAVEETLGGHSIERHVGKSNRALRDRLKDEDIPAASTYGSFTEAKKYMNKVAQGNKRKIEEWLKSGKGGDRGTETFTSQFPGEEIGRRITKDEAKLGKEPSSSDQATIVLKRDADAPGGYIVVTSFPGSP
ncbi:hypothetical protein CP970_26920 [Streptomyces kanamyceticus]|uniref:Bacterial CdiA-CT RNAse A domain-containing protein n=1 Tax=Streptomyces kanamyceticus TaxID=1967 RepID=A0A5J6GIY7_STRKN|nr:hypothetical protein CP970_26920 [Streptomyces kanamyceticus]